MPGDNVGVLLRETMLVALKLGGPPLLAALAIGIVMSLLQAITQINEQTVAFVPKVVVILGALLILGPFMLMTMTDFSHSLFDQVVAVGNR